MTITQSELQAIIEEHQAWLRGEGGQCADLGDSDLRGANMYGADLTGAIQDEEEEQYHDNANARDAHGAAAESGDE